MMLQNQGATCKKASGFSNTLTLGKDGITIYYMDKLKKRKQRAEKEQRFRGDKVFSIKLTFEQYEWLKKQARDAGHCIVGRYIKDEIFGDGKFKYE